MKTDIWVKCSAKITKKKGISKSQNLSNFWVSDAWRILVRFGKQTHRYKAKTLTFPEWRFFRGSVRIWQYRKFLLSLYQASTLIQPQERGRTQENRGKEGQPDSDSQTSFFLIELDVHVYIARCLFGVRKGFEGPTPTKRPCKVVNAPKSHSPSTNCVASGWSGSETVESDIPWQKISTK